MNFKIGIILTAKKRSLNEISQETLIHHYHYIGKKITIVVVKNPQKINYFKKFTRELTFNH